MSAKPETSGRKQRLIRELIDDAREDPTSPGADEPLRAYADALENLTRWLFEAAREELPDVLGPEDFDRFASMAAGAHPGSVAHPGTVALDRIERLLDLSETEVGALFGISRQAITSWRAKGIPRSRQRRLADIMRIADLLHLRLIPDRIPGIVRTPSPAYGGRTMLEMIADGEEQELLAQLRSTFDWARTA
ncbi:MAG: hypothetical protein WD004_02020 [Actinomycetota bacterium]